MPVGLVRLRFCRHDGGNKFTVSLLEISVGAAATTMAIARTAAALMSRMLPVRWSKNGVDCNASKLRTVRKGGMTSWASTLI